MAIDIDKAQAVKLLHASYMACSEAPAVTCPIRETIDFVIEDGKLVFSMEQDGMNAKMVFSK